MAIFRAQAIHHSFHAGFNTCCTIRCIHNLPNPVRASERSVTAQSIVQNGKNRNKNVDLNGVTGGDSTGFRFVRPPAPMAAAQYPARAPVGVAQLIDDRRSEIAIVVA